MIAVVLAFGVLVGASSGLGYATAVRVAGTVASGRGLALGLVVSAYAVGSAVLAPVASTASTSSPLRRRLGCGYVARYTRFAPGSVVARPT